MALCTCGGVGYAQHLSWCPVVRQPSEPFLGVFAGDHDHTRDVDWYDGEAECARCGKRLPGRDRETF